MARRRGEGKAAVRGGGRRVPGAGAGELAWPEGAPSPAEFASRVWEEGRARYRDLPWRGIDDPYAVLVSEIMLQQTQVARVERFWTRFLAAFPTVDALAAGATADVLELWQGLGYNRRALALKRAADACAATRAGRLPETAEELQELPGIGPATAAGVVAFAYQRPATYLETNVRSVFLHELFPGREGVTDRELRPLVEATCDAADPRGWYYALLDYGAYLKGAHANPSRRSAHHARQSAFEGSRRQKRAWVVRRVLAAEEGVAAATVLAELDAAERAAGREAVDPALFDSIVDDLAAEGFFTSKDGRLRA